MRLNVLMTVLLGSGLLTGCFHGTVQTARTAGQGNFEIGVRGSGILVLEDYRLPRPDADIAVRYGLSDNLDVGLRLGLRTGPGVSLKRRFGSNSSNWIKSVAPSVSFFGLIGDEWFSNIEVPLLMEYTLSTGDSLMITAAALAFIGGGGDGEEFSMPEYPLPIPGASIGVGYAMRMGKHVTLIPHASAGVHLIVPSFMVGLALLLGSSNQ